MKLNDPFGRMENRHQKGYEAMRDTLRDNGITTSQAARRVIVSSKKRALNFLFVGMAILLPLTLIFPKAMPVTLSLMLFLGAWVVSSIINVKRYVQRYIDEDLPQG
ncbi:MAG: hypothetical protein WBB19_05285 [Desulforhopalus sp.]